jgi:hypothetical protein
MKLYLKDGSFVDPEWIKPGDLVILQLQKCDVDLLQKEGRITDITSGQFVSVVRDVVKCD